MRKIEASSPETHSVDIALANIELLTSIFPELITEGDSGFLLNVDVLKALVGDKTVNDADEKYGLNWHGKRSARQIALTPSTGTLRPSLEDSLDWETTQNLMIEGDNLEVLKLLQKSYANKVKLIYIDPPYNTGNDFVYPDNFHDNVKNYLELTGQADGGKKISSNTETSGRFHTDWLNMMYPRLKLARNLLTREGLIVIHIDEHEVHALKLLLNEVFGEENDLGICVWDKRNPKGDARGIASQHEYIVMFARDADALFEISPLKRPKPNADRMLRFANEAVNSTESIEDATIKYRSWLKTQKSLSGGEAMYDRISPDGRVYRLVSMAWPNKKTAPESYFLALQHPITKKPCPVPARGWRNPPDTMNELNLKGLIEFGVDETTQPQRRYFLDENIYENVPSVIPFGKSDDALLKELGIPFDQPKPVELAAALIGWCSSSTDIIMDFFAGSGTTGHAVMSQNLTDKCHRRYLLVQLPELLELSSADQKLAAEFCDVLGHPRNIAELTKERLRRSGKKILKEYPSFEGDTGFRVFKLDSSNFQAWNPNRLNLELTLVDHQEHLLENRSELDILYELLLKLGLNLNVPIEHRNIADTRIYAVGGGVLLACLASSITSDTVEVLAESIIGWKQELIPIGEVTCIFRDNSFLNDIVKTNMAAILNQNGIQNIRCL